MQEDEIATYNCYKKSRHTTEVNSHRANAAEGVEAWRPSGLGQPLTRFEPPKARQDAATFSLL